MGYSKFDGNEEDVMESLLHAKKVPKEELSGYPYQIKSLLRKKMIISEEGFYRITKRGENAIVQQIKLGEYWVAPLKSKPFKLDRGTLKISKELKGYITSPRKRVLLSKRTKSKTGEGKGWHREPVRHRIAAIKGHKR